MTNTSARSWNIVFASIAMFAISLATDEARAEIGVQSIDDCGCLRLTAEPVPGAVRYRWTERFITETLDIYDMVLGVTESPSISVPRPWAFNPFTRFGNGGEVWAHVQAMNDLNEVIAEDENWSLLEWAGGDPFITISGASSIWRQTGDSIRLRASSHVGDPISIQWFRNGAPLAGETRDCLELGDGIDLDGASITVSMQTQAGRFVSPETLLSVKDPPPGNGFNWVAVSTTTSGSIDACSNHDYFDGYVIHSDPISAQRTGNDVREVLFDATGARVNLSSDGAGAFVLGEHHSLAASIAFAVARSATVTVSGTARQWWYTCGAWWQFDGSVSVDGVSISIPPLDEHCDAKFGPTEFVLSPGLHVVDFSANGFQQGCCKTNHCRTNSRNSTLSVSVRIAPTTCELLGDINADGRIDGADLGAVLSCWGPVTSTATSRACDIDKNDVVNGADLGLLLSGWGPCPN